MEKVILKPGDSVRHATLGEGTVTVADEAFITVKFESREAMFRLPDAFEDGFLTSKDAVIIEEVEDIDEEEEEEEEEEVEDEVEDDVEEMEDVRRILNHRPQKPKRRISVLTIVLGLILCLFFLPIGIELFKAGIETGEPFFYVLSTICFCAPVVGPIFASVMTNY